MSPGIVGDRIGLDRVRHVPRADGTCTGSLPGGRDALQGASAPHP